MLRAAASTFHHPWFHKEHVHVDQEEAAARCGGRLNFDVTCARCRNSATIYIVTLYSVLFYLTPLTLSINLTCVQVLRDDDLDP